MLKVILKRVTPLAKEIIAEEHAGFRAESSGIEQISRILYEKYLRHQHKQNLYHVFIATKKLFWQSMARSLMGHHAEVQYQCESSSQH